MFIFDLCAGFEVHQIVQVLNGFSAELTGWAAVIAGLGVFTLLLALDDRRKRPREIVAAAAPARRLEPGRDWERITDIAARDLARAPELASMQARAALQIDAAEHAYNRMLAECRTVIRPPVVPTLEPVHEHAGEPKTPAQQQPLAA